MQTTDTLEVMKLYLDRLDGDDLQGSTDRVMLANDLIHAATRLLQDEVERARSAGVTGNELGSALGVTRQAVYQRFPIDGAA